MKGSTKTILVVFDEIVIINAIRTAVEETKKVLEVKFKVEDLGECRYYLGI